MLSLICSAQKENKIVYIYRRDTSEGSKLYHDQSTNRITIPSIRGYGKSASGGVYFLGKPTIWCPLYLEIVYFDGVNVYLQLYTYSL